MRQITIAGDLAGRLISITPPTAAYRRLNFREVERRLGRKRARTRWIFAALEAVQVIDYEVRLTRDPPYRPDARLSDDVVRGEVDVYDHR